MEQRNSKFVTAHAGARDYYQLALGLYEAGFLHYLVTDWYSPDWLYRALPKLAASRYRSGLPSSKTRICFEALAYAAKMRLRDSFSDNIHKDKALSQCAYKVASRNGAHLFLYSYYAWDAFTKASQESRGITKLLFQLHPHPESVRELLREELELVPAAKDSILYENEMRYSDEYVRKLSEESSLADQVMVASSYTSRTLVDKGVPESSILVNPYGTDGSLFKRRSGHNIKAPFKVIFVGSMVQRKGLSYLLDAIAELKTKEIELVLCGRGFIDRRLIEGYSGLDISVKVGLDADSLLQEMHSADLFVLPSLSEGFAHVILEAMSAGLPVLTTSNTCGPDVIEEGLSGFVVPIRRADLLAEKIEWCLDNREVLFDMGQHAAQTALNFTWEKFRMNVSSFVSEQLNRS